MGTKKIIVKWYNHPLSDLSAFGFDKDTLIFRSTIWTWWRTWIRSVYLFLSRSLAIVCHLINYLNDRYSLIRVITILSVVDCATSLHNWIIANHISGVNLTSFWIILFSYHRWESFYKVMNESIFLSCLFILTIASPITTISCLSPTVHIVMCDFWSFLVATAEMSFIRFACWNWVWPMTIILIYMLSL